MNIYKVHECISYIPGLLVIEETLYRDGSKNVGVTRADADILNDTVVGKATRREHTTKVGVVTSTGAISAVGDASKIVGPTEEEGEEGKRLVLVVEGSVEGERKSGGSVVGGSGKRVLLIVEGKRPGALFAQNSK